MVAQVARPGLQHTDHPDLPTEKARIGGELLQSARRTAKEHGVELARVLARQRPQLGGEGEGHQGVGHGKEQRLLLGQPGLGLVVLAGWAVTIAAGVIAIAYGGAPRTGVDVAAQHFRAAVLDRCHGLALTVREPVPILLAVGRTILAEDITEGVHKISSSRSLITAVARWWLLAVTWV